MLVQISVFLFIKMISVFYFVLKLLPTNPSKILFCSRQFNQVPLDFILLQDEIKKTMPDAEFITICSHLNKSLKGYFLFSVNTVRSMYHLATGSICIIDSYWPAVSLLKHKKQLKVIQIWHSLGKTKKSGYQTLGKKSGRKSEIAYCLKMHENYDYFIGGAPIWNTYYCEAFNLPEEKIFNFGLPRIDYLLDKEQENKKKFFDAFPELREKKIVLYAPTFRKNMESHWEDITDAKRYDDIALIIKNHPGQKADVIEGADYVYYLNDWKTMDLIAVCDYMITDYSSIALEAAVLKKKTFYWTYDYDEYMANSGINLDLKVELSDNVFDNIDELMECIEYNRYNVVQQNAFIKKYLPEKLGGSTKKIAELVINLILDQREEYYAAGNYGRWKGTSMEESFVRTQTFGGNRRRTSDLQNNTAVTYDDAKELGSYSHLS